MNHRIVSTAIAVLLTAGLGALASESARADVFTVTTLADAGAGSLREAIVGAAENSGPDEIVFDLPGAVPHRIRPLQQLDFLATGTTLDGTSQPGYDGAPVIFLDGSQLATGAGLRLFGDDITVRGLAVGNFPENGIVIGAGTGNRVSDSFLGTDTTGTVAAPNGISGLILGDSIETIVERNLISGNDGSGFIALNFGADTPGATGTIIRGNRIGTDRSGLVALPNQGNGLFIRRSDGNIIGGPDPGDGNHIAGNLFAGATLAEDANDNLFEGNVFGSSVDRTFLIGNTDGVFIQQGSGNELRGNVFALLPSSGMIIEGPSNDNRIVGNLFDGNVLNAIRICCDQDESGIFPQRNTISGNVIFANPDNAAIELGLFDGNDPQDPLDEDTGPNGRQNTALLLLAELIPGALRIDGSLRGALSTRYRIEFFASAACQTFNAGPGERFLGAIDVTSNGIDGETPFTTELPVFVPAGAVLTATVTAPNGDSSEFGPCLLVPAPAQDVLFFDSLETRRTIDDFALTGSILD